MALQMRILITGGAGFIGAEVVKQAMASGAEVLNVDKLTYAAMPENLSCVENHVYYTFLEADICDKSAMQKAFNEFQPTTVLHLAAESHVDRSISGASDFMNTNIMGTFTLLEVARTYWESGSAPKNFRFVHVSTDEVYGDLPNEDAPAFSETTPYQPNSPYSASKAASDFLARAWHQTYGLPVVITHCSNNYGPGQYPEKLIPLVIQKALNNEKLPIYGDGANIRDWIHVQDHARGILTAAEKGKIGETYNFGGECEIKNITLVWRICSILNDLVPLQKGHYFDLHTFVTDRKGHDFRYAIDNTKVIAELGWTPEISFSQGLEETVNWYVKRFTHEGHHSSGRQRNAS